MQIISVVVHPVMTFQCACGQSIITVAGLGTVMRCPSCSAEHAITKMEYNVEELWKKSEPLHPNMAVSLSTRQPLIVPAPRGKM